MTPPRTTYIEIEKGSSIAATQRKVVESALEQYEWATAEGYLGIGVEARGLLRYADGWS